MVKANKPSNLWLSKRKQSSYHCQSDARSSKLISTRPGPPWHLFVP